MVAGSLRHLIVRGASQHPEAAAIGAPGRPPLSYSGLLAQMDSVQTRLRACGIGPAGRVALVLPNGPEMATAVVGVGAAAVCAPLNPGYSADELDFYLADLDADALIVQPGVESAAEEVARERGISILELVPELGAAAGAFRLAQHGAAKTAAAGAPGPQDVALLLHTSGTTSRPKLVAILQANLSSSAVSIAEGLRLSPTDRCLNIMPLFHVHGIVGALLSSLSAGAQVACAPGLLVSDFFEWVAELAPTWYTAVPTMHQLILSRAGDNAATIEAHRLRFVRSCSARMPPAVMARLEETFEAPVLEAYGMTEAAHQIACNPLPPAVRKPGSVGTPTGTRITILDDEGNRVPAGTTGEVAIRGPNVICGYEHNPEANRTSFADGWFRTGDLGYLDDTGYLFLTGRLKEIINRGGEKISPAEIDDVLIQHPAVAQAVAFALPDDQLGEDVGAAVVLKPGAKADARQIRRFAADHLAYFKVPRRVVLVSEVPKGPTGKLQRIGLAQRLGLDSSPADEAGSESAGRAERGAAIQAPRSAVDEQLLRIWRELLGTGEIGIDDGFFDCGGDSLLATALLKRVRQAFGATVPLVRFVLDPTVRFLGDVIAGEHTPPPSSLVPVRQGGSRPPFFGVHAHDGRIFLYHDLARHLDKDRPVYAFHALDPIEDDGSTAVIEDLAARYVEEMTALEPAGPYYLGGYCFGALVAFEMARRLEAGGRQVAMLALMDAYAPGFPQPDGGTSSLHDRTYALLDRVRRFGAFLSYVRGLESGRRWAYVRGFLKRERSRSGHSTNSTPRAARRLPGGGSAIASRYKPEPYPGAAVLLRPTREPLGFKRDPTLGWGRLVRGDLRVEDIPGYHRTLAFWPRIRLLAERLESHLAASQRRAQADRSSRNRGRNQISGAGG